MKQSFKAHPEQGENEVFLGNCSLNEKSKISWFTRRFGHHAFDHKGEPLPGKIPVFVEKGEYNLWIRRMEQPSIRRSL